VQTLVTSPQEHEAVFHRVVRPQVPVMRAHDSKFLSAGSARGGSGTSPPSNCFAGEARLIFLAKAAAISTACLMLPFGMVVVQQYVLAPCEAKIPEIM
jgi:hypothetical protein